MLELIKQPDAYSQKQSYLQGMLYFEPFGPLVPARLGKHLEFFSNPGNTICNQKAIKEPLNNNDNN